MLYFNLLHQMTASFLRKQESICLCLLNWIPTFVGMTKWKKKILFENTEVFSVPSVVSVFTSYYF